MNLASAVRAALLAAVSRSDAPPVVVLALPRLERVVHQQTAPRDDVVRALLRV